jgi:hypothetical protein
MSLADSPYSLLDLFWTMFIFFLRPNAPGLRGAPRFRLAHPRGEPA